MLSLIKSMLLIPLLLLSGCASFSYYLDAINGHHEVLSKQRPVSDWLNDSSLDEKLRKRLHDMQLAREFASQELLLPDNQSYRNYADIGRDYVVWNVIATRPFSVKAKQWCFLFAGCLNYRGYFSRQDAEDYAKQLEQQGYDIYVAGARAYSTLGWFDDPLLNTMLFRSQATSIGIMFHELAHQKLYVSDDSAFNEAFAVFVEQEGIKRWFDKQNNSEAYDQFLKERQRRQQLNELLISIRQRLDKVYQSSATVEQKKRQKAHLFGALREEYAVLKMQWHGYSGYDKWIEQPLNNAHLALVATYHEYVPAFRQLFHSQANQRLEQFYNAAQQIADLPGDARQAELERLMQQHR